MRGESGGAGWAAHRQRPDAGQKSRAAAGEGWQVPDQSLICPDIGPEGP